MHKPSNCSRKQLLNYVSAEDSDDDMQTKGPRLCVKQKTNGSEKSDITKQQSVTGECSKPNNRPRKQLLTYASAEDSDDEYYPDVDCKQKSTG
jgi:hypothetical protein